VTLHAAVYLYAPEEVLTRRLLGRASQGGRADDVADVIQHRLRVFAEATGPLVAYYRERGILIAVDADQPPDSVIAEIQAWLSEISLTAPAPDVGGFLRNEPSGHEMSLPIASPAMAAAAAKTEDRNGPVFHAEDDGAYRVTEQAADPSGQRQVRIRLGQGRACGRASGRGGLPVPRFPSW
jgi:hypothetical protein